MRTVDSYSEGDGFHSPRVDGFDILLDKLYIEVDKYPRTFDDMVHDLLDRYEFCPEEFRQEMYDYLQSRLDDEFDFDGESYDEYIERYS